MKKFFTLCAASMMMVIAFAQSPERMSYQAVIRNASNVLVSNSTVGMQISILQGSPTGPVVYEERHTPTTNANGLVSIEIGGGTVVSGLFSTINWANGPYFIKTETDPSGGTSYSITGTSQLLSVPYALYAKTSGSSTPGPQGIPGIPGTPGTNGTNGVDGADGVNGKNSLVKTSAAAAADCPTGGVKLEYGLDANANGILDAGEINAALTQFVCNGAVGATGTQGIPGIPGTPGANGTNGSNGKNTLVKTSVAAAADCPTGGVKLEYGLDANANGVLDAGEINAALTTFVCNGIQGLPGANGTNGLDGKNSLVKTSVATATDCPTGGVKLEYGIDANSNGTLDAGEINAALTTFVCNGTQGTNGTNGKNTLVKTSAAAAADCPTGGVKLEYGIDANANGTLDAGEINAALTTFVCNGIQGAAGSANINGTTNYLVKYTNATTGGNSNIFDNGTTVAIGTSSPNASAALEVNSTAGAFLLPRMTTAQRDALTATPGMVIFNTTTGTIQGYHKETVNNGIDQYNTNINGNSPNNTPVGQSFTATYTGYLRSISVLVNSNNNGHWGTLTVRAGNGTTGTILTTQTIYTATSNWDYVEYTLATPVPITAGSSYTFEFAAGPNAYSSSNSNPYAGGNAYYGGSSTGSDIYFVTKVDGTSSTTKWSDL